MIDAINTNIDRVLKRVIDYSNAINGAAERRGMLHGLKDDLKRLRTRVGVLEAERDAASKTPVPTAASLDRRIKRLEVVTLTRAMFCMSLEKALRGPGPSSVRLRAMLDFVRRDP